MSGRRIYAAIAGVWCWLGAAGYGLAEPAVVLPELTGYSAGPYTLWAAPFSVAPGSCGEGLATPAHYLAEITYRPQTFPNDVTFTSNWPSAPCKTGVYGFVNIEFGDYNNTGPHGVTPTRIGALETLTHTIAWTGRYASADNCDLIADLFTTMAPGSTNAHTHELDIALHVPRSFVRFYESSRDLGAWTDPQGRSWLFGLGGSILIIKPADDRDVQGVIDIGAMLKHGIEIGALASTEYFNGDAIGVESNQGDCSVTLQSIETSYK